MKLSGNWLTVELSHAFRFVVERRSTCIRRAARHIKIDDALGFRWEMQACVAKAPGLGFENR